MNLKVSFNLYLKYADFTVDCDLDTKEISGNDIYIKHTKKQLRIAEKNWILDYEKEFV